MSGQFAQYTLWTWQNLLSCLKRGYFALAYRAHLPDTVAFVRGTIVRIVQWEDWEQQRSAAKHRHLISWAISSKYCRFMLPNLTNFGKDASVPDYSCFFTMIYSYLRKLWVKTAHFKKYISLNEQRYAFMRVKWQITAQSCIYQIENGFPCFF